MYIIGNDVRTCITSGKQVVEVGEVTANSSDMIRPTAAAFILTTALRQNCAGRTWFRLTSHHTT